MFGVTKSMELDFGYNCKHFVPAFGKCRKLIDSYRSRKDLVEQKWLNSQELLVYLNVSKKGLLGKIASGEIKTKVQKHGKVTFGVSAAWQYDGCYLVGSGGQCLYFEKHNGKTISCLVQLEGLAAAEHPNYCSTPSEADTRTFEDDVFKIIGMS